MLLEIDMNARGVSFASAFLFFVMAVCVLLPARAGGKAVTVLQLLTLGACIVRSRYAQPLAWATAAVGLYAIWDYGRAAARANAQR